MFEESGVGFKNRVMIVAFLLTSAFVFIFVALIYTASQSDFKKTKKEFEKDLSAAISQTVNSTIDTYSILADTVLNTTEAKALMKAERRDELYALLESKWKLWSTNNPDFRIMLFHRADGTAFLRMHKPAVFDDYLAGIRPMVKAVHEQQKVLIGYETGKYSTVFRILTPIFHEGEYLGALDFGINPNYFIKRIYEFTGQKGVLFIKDENLKLFKHASTMSLSGYTLQSSMSPDIQELLEGLPFTYDFRDTIMLEDEDVSYSVHVYGMTDYKNDEKAKLLFFNDMTYTIKMQQEFTLILTMTSIIFVILMFFLLNQSFNKLLISLKKMHDQHTQELKEAQAMTAFNEKFLNTVLDTNKNIIISTIGKETLYSANQTFLDFTGFDSIEDFESEHECMSELFLPDSDESFLRQQQNGVHWIEYIYQNPTKTFKAKMRKDGEIHTFLVTANRMRLDNNKRNVITFSDITEIVNIQKMLQEKDALLYRQSKLAAMGEMISMIAHQWRQPLGSISAATGGLKLQLELDMFNKETFDQKLDDINGYVQYMSKTVDDFRNFYRPDKTRELISLKEVVSSSLTIMEPVLKQHNIKVDTWFETDEPIDSYTNELVQVVLNLIKNAKDAHVEQGTTDPSIKLTVLKNDDETQTLIVSDNNGGVPEELIDKIFEPYFTTKDERNGTGLGLYMSKTIIEEHCGGTLSVKNDNGAHFMITLPVGIH
ncbi:MAG: cache domain-containing protein [Sulfurimonadaceae bacterium]|nr:cache domain-containing protein [Sulfurimonadaceae bacterium]